MNNHDPQPENTEETDALRAEAPAAQDQRSLLVPEMSLKAFPKEVRDAWHSAEWSHETGPDRHGFLYFTPKGTLNQAAKPRVWILNGLAFDIEREHNETVYRLIKTIVEFYEKPHLTENAPRSEAVTGVAAEGESVPQKEEVVGQPSLPEVLKEIEERIRVLGKSDSVEEILDAAEIVVKDHYALVKALRRAMDQLEYAQSLHWLHSTAHEQEIITSILTSAGLDKSPKVSDSPILDLSPMIDSRKLHDKSLRRLPPE